MNDLYYTPLQNPNQRVAGAADVDDIELTVKQYLFFRLANVRTNTKILSCWPSKKISACLPPDWFSTLGNHGFLVDSTLCRLKWLGYMSLLLGYAILLAKIEIYKSFRYQKYSNKILSGSAVLVRYRDNFLPESKQDLSKGKQNHTIMSWYGAWVDRPKDVNTLVFQAQNETHLHSDGFSFEGVRTNAPPLKPLQAIYLLLWTMTQALFAFFSLLRGRWWNSLMLHEAVLAMRTKLTPGHGLARQYLFEHSVCGYKPLWTYGAEKRGSECLIYFYSTNSAGFLDHNYNRFPFGAFQLMNWSRYLVWSEEHRVFMAEACKKNLQVTKSQFHNVGPIPFEDSGLLLETVAEPAIAAFDVSPVRDALYWPLGSNVEYYVHTVVNKFLDDIQSSAKILNCSVLYKKKRDKNRAYHKKYSRHCDKMNEWVGWHEIDASVSAFRVVELADLVISLPFTSTGLIGVAQGKASIYYDPTGSIQHNDEAALGVPVVNNKEQLQEWMRDELLRRGYETQQKFGSTWIKN